MFLAMIRYLLSGERQQTNRYKGKRVATEISPIANFHFYVHGNVLNTFSITKPIADPREHSRLSKKRNSIAAIVI